MKIKNLFLSLIVFFSFIYAGDVTPMLGLRFNDVAGSTELLGPGQTLGLKMQVGDNIYSGFDTNGTDFRIFVQQSFGMFGLGTNDDGEPQFTVGAYYYVLENLNVSLDYVINRLTDDDNNLGSPYPDEIRMTLGISF